MHQVVSNQLDIDRRLSVAPMMERTDRHFRYFLRLISHRTLLYTEMVHARAVLNGDRERMLGYSAEEHPVALQLGGSEPRDLARAAAAGESMGYDEINLNVGCPSDRVQAGRFGACLMKEPDTVARCVEAMRREVHVPVTVKCRIGVDELDHFDHLAGFIATVADAGCEVFVIHARKAWLKGLSPKENRNKPPLDYDRVLAIRETFPQYRFVLNGGIRDLDQASHWLEQVDGVMLGRAVCDDPWLLAEADERIYQDRSAATRDRIATALAYADYAERRHAAGVPARLLLRNIHGLFQGRPGARRWRRALTEGLAAKDGRGPKALIESALQVMEEGARAA